MNGSFEDNPFLRWAIILMLEATFLGFCIVFVGAGLTEIKKKRNIFKNVVLVATGIVLALMSFLAMYLFLV